VIQLDEEQTIAVGKLTRPRTLRWSTLSCCRSAAFSASSRPIDLIGLNGEANILKSRHSSATMACGR
jgi:hypothetical protein